MPTEGRCATCRWWIRNAADYPELPAPLAQFGACGAVVPLAAAPSPEPWQAFAVGISTAPGDIEPQPAVLLTGPAFGCRRWEPDDAD